MNKVIAYWLNKKYGFKSDTFFKWVSFLKLRLSISSFHQENKSFCIFKDSKKIFQN